MATVSSSSSISSALGVTGKGIGGLATGLNTDELVAALTSGTKGKIAKQGQQKQLLNWKMTAYRNMTSALNAFQTKFLKLSTSTSSNTNITSSKFFNTYKATSSSDKVSVSATSGAVTGNFTINEVTKLAESESFTSKNKMSTTLSLDIDPTKNTYSCSTFDGQTLKLEVDRFSVKNIKLDSLGDPESGVINADGTINTEQLQKKLQELIDAAYNGSRVVDVKRDETTGELWLDSNSAKVTVSGSTSLFALGKDESKSSRVTMNTTVGKLDAFKNVQGNVLTFNINGKEITVNKDDTISQMMTKVNSSGANVTMAYDQNKDVFTLTSKLFGADSKIEMKDVQGNLLSEIFGAQSGNSIGTDLLTRSDSISFNDIQTIDTLSEAEKKSYVSKLSNMSFDLTINGVTKTVKLDLSLGIGSDKLNKGTYTSTDVYNAINKGIQNSFYGSGVEFGQYADGKTYIETSKNEAFTINAKGEFAAMLGISPSGTAVNAGNIITDYGYNSAIKSFDDIGNIDVANLTSNSFEMTINGRTETVTVTPAKDANGNDIALTNDNFLARLNAAVKEKFGNDAAGVSFSATYTKVPEYKQLTDDEKAKYTFQAADDGDKLSGYYNEKGDRVADVDGIALDKDGKQVVAKQNTTSLKLTLNVPENAFKVTETSVSMSGALANQMGFTVNETAVTSNTNTLSTSAVTLGQLNGGGDMNGGTITLGNGETVSYTKDTKLQDLLDDLNQKLNRYQDTPGSAGIKDGKLYIKTLGDFSIEDNGDLLNNIFGISGGSFATKEQSYGDNFKAGVNAEYVIDNVKYTSSSNNISHNGVTITLNQASDVAIQIGVQADPDDVITRIKEWMDDYNALVYTLNSAINEGKNRNYDPLTDDQKAEMTDDQIKTWETEAKKGILRSDQTLRQILADMRNAMYAKVESAGISLYDLGIVTKSGLSDSNQAGQLEFDANITGGGEERLRNMLLNDPDKVRTFFSDADNGLGARLNNIITQAASTSSVNRGSLVRIAGTEQLTGDNTSQLGNKITALDKYIATLKTRLETEYSRYWKQFSSLETSVNKMNTQSSWLQSQ